MNKDDRIYSGTSFDGSVALTESGSPRFGLRHSVPEIGSSIDSDLRFARVACIVAGIAQVAISARGLRASEPPPLASPSQVESGCYGTVPLCQGSKQGGDYSGAGS